MAIVPTINNPRFQFTCFDIPFQQDQVCLRLNLGILPINQQLRTGDTFAQFIHNGFGSLKVDLSIRAINSNLCLRNAIIKAFDLFLGCLEVNPGIRAINGDLSLRQSFTQIIHR